MKKKLAEKNANRIKSGCSRTALCPVVTDTGLHCTKMCLRSFFFKKFQILIFKALTAVSCPLKVLDSFT